MVSDAECEEKALAWCKLVERTVNFTLTDETEISLGIIVNLTGQSSFGINAFKLEGVTIEPIAPSNPDGIGSIEKEKSIVNSEKPVTAIYDLSGRKVFNAQSSTPNGVKKGIYIQGSKKVLK